MVVNKKRHIFKKKFNPKVELMSRNLFLTTQAITGYLNNIKNTKSLICKNLVCVEKELPDASVTTIILKQLSLKKKT